MKEIYLDNCATTRPRKEVVEAMLEALEEDYGNPSSLHRKGFETEKKLDRARESVADFLGVDREEIYFTSGGTESNNLAIQSILRSHKNKGKHIVTSSIEHSSVTNIMKYYEEEGYEVSYLDVDRDGFIDLDELENSLREDTILISLIYVNNEIGTIQPVEAIRSILNRKGIDAKIHLDAIQGVGKVPMDIRGWGVDTVSFSGHKIYGPKGIGGLYVKKGLRLDPIVFGGNQERGLRSGTENVPGILGLGRAFEILDKNFEKEYNHSLELKNYLLDRIVEEIDGVRINSPRNERTSPYIANLSFESIKAEILLHYLENENIYISTGSACSKGTIKSPTLLGIGLDDSQIDGAIRLCFSPDIDKEDLDIFIDKSRAAVKEIREITMR